MLEQRVQRRQMLKGALGLAAAGSLGVNWTRRAAAQDLQGVTLRVVSIQDPFFEPLKSLIPDFEEKTGAAVELEGVQYAGLRDKIVLDVVGGSGTYDVLSIDTMWTGEFAEGNYALPLDDLITRDAEQVNREDLSEGLWSAFSWKGQTYSVPLSVYAKMLLYRKDLWEDPTHQQQFKEKYGYDLIVPQTWDQFRDMAEYFTQDWDGDGQPNYGVAFNGKRGASIVHHFFAYADNFGATWFQSYPEEPWDFTPTINSEAMKEALRFYVGLRQFAPPNVTDFEWFDTGGAYWNGQVAMMYHWSVYASLAADPSQSKIVGNVAAGMPPALDPASARSQLGGWALGISSRSQQQEAAWEFIKWATSTETLLRMTTEHTFDAVNRESVLSHPDFQARYPWAETLKNSLAIANPEYRPRIPAYVQMEEVLGVRLNEALTGELTPEEALDKAQEQIVEIMKDFGYL